MRLSNTILSGSFVIDIEPHEDHRGFFARTFCSKEFDALGLSPKVAQTSIAFNRRKGTLRGLHFQFPPASETKLVRCTAGSILDVIVDLRPESPTFLTSVSVVLSSVNRRAMYIPKRFAHGYQVLEDDSEVVYQMDEFFHPELAQGLAYNDPLLGVDWPLPITAISEKDRNWPSLSVQLTDIRRRMTADSGNGG